MAGTRQQAPVPVRRLGPTPHWLARPFVACKTIAPMIASVTAAPRKSLAMLVGGRRRADGSRLACHRCQHLIRPAGSPAPMPQWVPTPAPAGTSGPVTRSLAGVRPAAVTAGVDDGPRPVALQLLAPADD